MAALILSGCGGDAEPDENATADEPEQSAPADGPELASLDPAELLQLSDEALRGAESYTSSARSEVDGARGTFMDLMFVGAERCDASVATVNGNVGVIREADDLWVQLDRMSLEAVFDEATVELLANHHLHGPLDDPGLAEYAAMCERGGLPEPVLDGQPAEDGYETTLLTVEDGGEHHGTPVVAVRREESGGTGEGPASVTTTLLIAAEGEPYPLLLTGEMEFDFGTMVNTTEYSRFGDELPFRVPPETATVDVSELGDALPPR
ncbi:hypothetical protein [Streptomyces hainanensis]|uniref:Lipoprotein n=1 Tax=Streptomyces hainanensis TaxID=402648 RepID=A0A4V2Y3M5_9ACTN|nr:hypothetical protein [Streptomyces hainanensis]TDC77075.1 hypothetical protein E1283_08265 [Streptomyces hainanensis]